MTLLHIFSSLQSCPPSIYLYTYLRYTVFGAPRGAEGPISDVTGVLSSSDRDKTRGKKVRG